jgi:hypothetical protein
MLTGAQALVLYELLHRWQTEGAPADLPEYERQALWRLLGALERSLTEIHEPDYDRRLDEARRELTDIA